ncbi:hypothetical protein L1049_014319 [Liquidambar formosana]|uniref:Uncharacterized protein n=1 Tax=Liquidambar formosana TaxID=63359 RepID=A0AAP0RMN3_LIQFO
MERMRESTSKRYRELQIPWEWMLDTGVTGQLKLSSMRLAREYMKRIAQELQSNECSQEEDLMLQGVRFAYRVHQVGLKFLHQIFPSICCANNHNFQFAGGFDADTTRAFEELRQVGMVCHAQWRADNKT